MLFGNPLEKTVDDISQKLDELKSQRKLVELDLEKRILVLENTAGSLQKLLGNIKDFEAAKDTISRMEELQNKLRDIEDTSLISRLETVQSDDRIALIDEGITELKQKVALLSDAIDILSEPKANVQDSNAKLTPNELALLKADVASMKDAILRLDANTINPKKMESLEEEVAKDQSSILSIEKEFKELTGTVREKIEFFERSIKNQKRVEIPDGIAREIVILKKEIERVKDIEAKIVNQIESDSRKLQDLKLLQDERKDYDSLKNGMEVIQKTVSMLKKEMDLDRTMYPEKMMWLEKEIAGINGAKKEAATIADVQKLSGELEYLLREHKSLKEKIPKYEESINLLIKNNDALKSGVSETVKTVKQTLSESAELKKDVMSFTKNIAGIKCVQDKMIRVAETVDLMGAEISAQKEGASKAIRELNAKVSQLESGGKHPFGAAVEKMETDIRILRKELSLAKDVPQGAGGNFDGISREITLLKHNLSETLKISERLVSENAEIKAQLNALGAANGYAVEKEGVVKMALEAARKSRNSRKSSVPESANTDTDSPPHVDVELHNISSALKSITDENGALKSELGEFKVLVSSLMEANQQLAEGLNETRLEIDEMRQKQPIIID